MKAPKNVQKNANATQYTALGYEKKNGALSDKELAEKMVGVFNAAIHKHGVATSFVPMGATSNTENGIKAGFGGDIEFQIFFDDVRYKCCIHENVCGDVVRRFAGTMFHNVVEGKGFAHGYKFHKTWKCKHEISVQRVENEATLHEFVADVARFLGLCIGTNAKNTATPADTAKTGAVA